MSDNEEEEETGPAVELGDGPLVEGAPLARVASRLTWPIERSRLLDREGDSTIRTPDGPRTVADVLADVETTYFDTRQTFLEAVRDEVGRGPVQTAGDEGVSTLDTGDGAGAGEPASDGARPDDTGDGVEPASDGDAVGENGDGS